MRKRFRLEENKELGGLGLRPVGTSHADPLWGMAVAHDILEHFHNDDGGVEAEFQALGASILVRDFGCYFALKGQYHTDAAENISSDFPDLISHVEYEGFSLLAPRRRKGCQKLGDPEAERIVVETVQKGAKLLREEHGIRLTEDQRWCITRWLRIGFRRATKRYQGKASSAELCHLFAETEKVADNIIKWHEFGDFDLHVNVARGRVHYEEVLEEDYY